MPQHIIRLQLVTLNNDIVTSCEKIEYDPQAWPLYEKLAFELTGEHKKEPIPPDRRERK